MDSLPPTTPQDLESAILWHQQRMRTARAQALEAVRRYSKDPSPVNLALVVGAQVLLTYRTDDLAALQLEVLRLMRETPRTH